MIFQTDYLPNGLRIVHIPSTSPVSYCGIAVKAGTRDEEEEEQGLAHFVEHMVFKGTQKRKAWHILNRMEHVGGELTAYTSKEETFIYSIFLQADFRRAIELIADLVYHSTFPAQAIEKERDVILDEISSYQDSPAELIYDEFEDMIYDGHTLGRNILGTPESLETFQTRHGLDFMERFYTPKNMVFFSSGATPFSLVMYYARKYLSEDIRNHPVKPRIKPALVLPVRREVEKETHQAHVLIGNLAYNLYDDRRNTLFFLNNLLGGPGMNNRLNVSLREKNGLVYDVESNVTNYSDTGIFSIYFGCDPKNKERCVSLVLKELKKLRENKLSTMQMTIARKQLIGQIAISMENRESTALNIGKSFLYFDTYETEESIYQRIEKITQSDLLETANEIFDEQRLFMLAYS